MFCSTVLLLDKVNGNPFHVRMVSLGNGFWHYQEAKDTFGWPPKQASIATTAPISNSSLRTQPPPTPLPFQPNNRLVWRLKKKALDRHPKQQISNLYDARTQRVLYHCFLDNKNKIKPPASTSIAWQKDSKGNIWVGTIVGGIFKITFPRVKKGNFPIRRILQQIQVTPLKTSLPATVRINFIKLLKNNQFIIGGQAGYGQIDYLKTRFSPLQLLTDGTNCTWVWRYRQYLLLVPTQSGT